MDPERQMVHPAAIPAGQPQVADANALPLSAGQFVCGYRRKNFGIQADKFEQFMDSGGDFCFRPVFQRGNESDVALDGEVRNSPTSV